MLQKGVAGGKFETRNEEKRLKECKRQILIEWLYGLDRLDLFARKKEFEVE